MPHQTEEKLSAKPTSEKPDQNISENATENASEGSMENRSENPIMNTAEKPTVNMPEQPIQDEQDDEFEEGFDDDEYIPDFIDDLLKNPPLLPGESKSEFGGIFEKYELFHNGRAKTVAEYMMVYQATTITWELMRYERMKVKIRVYNGRSAAEAIYRKSYENLATEGEPKEFKSSARKWTQHYFADPEYRKAYAAKLEAAGYGAGAVEAEAFQRSLYPLSQIERLIANLEKRLFSILKRLDEIYASRHPQMKMNRYNEPLLPDEE